MHCVLFNDNLDTKRRTMGPYKIANCMENMGWSATVVDWISSWPKTDLITYLDGVVHDDTKLFGISYTWLTSDYTKRLIKILKENYPDVKILLGGQQFIQHDLGADLYMYGYAEVALEKVINYWFNNGEQPKGMRPIELGGAQLIDCNKDYKAMDMHDYRVTYRDDDYIEPQEQLTIELSRGCRFSCKYCNYAFLGVKQDTSTDKELLRDELMQNYERWGTTNYIIADDTLNDRDSKLEMLAEVVESLPFKPNFSCFIRLDLTVSKPHQLELLSRARVWAHFYGVETLHHEAGKAVGKGMDPEKLKQGLLDMREHMMSRLGLYRGSLGMIAGLPHEPPESWVASEHWLRTNWHDQNWNWWPLEISAEDNLATVSEFSLDWEKHGYRSMQPDNPRREQLELMWGRNLSGGIQHKYDNKSVLWEADWADLKDAFDFVKRYKHDFDQAKISNFNILNYIGSDDITNQAILEKTKFWAWEQEKSMTFRPYINAKLNGLIT